MRTFHGRYVLDGSRGDGMATVCVSLDDMGTWQKTPFSQADRESCERRTVQRRTSSLTTRHRRHSPCRRHRRPPSRPRGSGCHRRGGARSSGKGSSIGCCHRRLRRRCGSLSS